MSIATHSDTGAKPRRVKPRSTPVTVAEYLTQQIALCGKTQSEIAREAGFNKPNIISMLKQGATKLPINKIAAMSKALGVDPTFLFRLVMSEYEPETWAVIEEQILHQPVISDNEFAIIQVIRKSNVINPQIRNSDDRKRLLEAVSHLHSENARPD